MKISHAGGDLRAAGKQRARRPLTALQIVRPSKKIAGRYFGRRAVAALLLISSGGLAGIMPAEARLAKIPMPIKEVRVSGRGSRPELFFACCDQSPQEMEALLADAKVIADLKDLQASIAFAVTDFSPLRAQLVRRLNEAGIPVIAWVELPREQGVYLSVDNVPESEARFDEFEKWTAANGLRWAGVGLDIEPESDSLSGSKFRLAWSFFKRSFESGRVTRAREQYAQLIRRLQSQGYVVMTYQLPFIVGERRAHSSLVERLFGIVDVRGDREVLMLYTSFARTFGAALIWKFGPSAQAIAIGSTVAEDGAPPLDWDEFSRDLIVASHFSEMVGVYDLEGCVQQGFLPRLKNMDWSQSVVISYKEINKVAMLGRDIGAALWILSHLLYFLAIVAVGFVLWIGWRVRGRNRKRRTSIRAAA